MSAFTWWSDATTTEWSPHLYSSFILEKCDKLFYELCILQSFVPLSLHCPNCNTMIFCHRFVLWRRSFNSRTTSVFHLSLLWKDGLHRCHTSWARHCRTRGGLHRSGQYQPMYPYLLWYKVTGVQTNCETKQFVTAYQTCNKSLNYKILSCKYYYVKYFSILK